MKKQTYREAVNNRYTIYNSLFLNLPFTDIYQTGTLLPIFEQASREGFEQDMMPREIVDQFLDDILPHTNQEERMQMLFKFIQYVERQIVLFDSVEDSAYGEINNLEGKGSLPYIFARAKADGLQQELIHKLRTFGLRIVLTAHPTQFYPGQVLGIITDLEEAIHDNNLKHIDLILQQLGKTPFLNKEKPSPFEEAMSLTWYLENVFYKTIPKVVQKVLDFSGLDVVEFDNLDLVSVGFWPGGDRDGNPFVTHETTELVAHRLRETALKCYYRDIRILKRRLTFKNIEERITLIEKKIFQSAYGEKSEGYVLIADLQNDLTEVRTVLIEKHESLFLDILDTFILKTKIFGFHMAMMDVRQDSRKHLSLWTELSGGSIKNWSTEPTEIDNQVAYLLDYKESVSPDGVTEDFHKEIIQSIQSIGNIQTTNGVQACDRYVISNSMHAADVIAVYVLARNILAKDGRMDLDIVPLFESIEHLEKADKVMDLLYSLPEYRKHLTHRGNKQTIMLGFSDGTKDGGYLQANYSIFKAKEALTAISRKHKIKVIFFDGRGGPPARGGGNTHDFYASLGPDIENKEIQLTIQGQTISANFGKPISCEYNIEQLLTAGIENDLYRDRFRSLNASERLLLDELAGKSYEAYKDLKSHPAFVSYLEKATPLQFFGLTNIGSRPVKRKGDDTFKFEDLRAIPFVGSWAQMKQNVPGFFGLGAAIEHLDAQGRLNEVSELYKNSLFFRALAGNSMQSLAKAFYPATSYLRFHKDYGQFWEIIFEEYRRTMKWLLEISGQEHLLDDNVLSRESINLREKIVLPLITIQQYALQNIIENGDKLSDRQAVLMQRLVLRCMYGIINAARNAA